jgi:hypothetical protein
MLGVDGKVPPPPLTILAEGGDTTSSGADEQAAGSTAGGASTSDQPQRLCTNVTVQLWMADVHPALDTSIAVGYLQNERFFKKCLTPRASTAVTWPPREDRVFALGDLVDRFMFDFLIGNTDRGMNDHNNFAYGGCTGDYRSSCKPPSDPLKRTLGRPKYAFLDQGSSFYSRKFPEGSPFTVKEQKGWICRFRRSTYDKLKAYARSPSDVKSHRRPLCSAAFRALPLMHNDPDPIFEVMHWSIFKLVQDRAEFLVQRIEECVANYTTAEVFSL